MEVTNSETKTSDEVFKENDKMQKVFPNNHVMLVDLVRIIDRWVHRKELNERQGMKDNQQDYVERFTTLGLTLHDILTRGNEMGICVGHIVRRFFDTQTECHSNLHKLWAWLKELESSSDYPVIKEEESEKEKTLKWLEELDNSLTSEYLVRRTTLETLPIEVSKYQEPIEMRVHVSAH